MAHEFTDDALIAIARGRDYPKPSGASDLAAELLRLRRQNRGDSRRAMQVRRLRWSVENLVMKFERFRVEVASIARTEDAGLPLFNAFIEASANMVELASLVRDLPLELDDASSGVISWLTSRQESAVDESDRTLIAELVAEVRGGALAVRRG